jgi:hypothetical protein
VEAKSNLLRSRLHNELLHRRRQHQKPLRSFQKTRTAIDEPQCLRSAKCCTILLKGRGELQQLTRDKTFLFTLEVIEDADSDALQPISERRQNDLLYVFRTGFRHFRLQTGRRVLQYV